jgi:hypothetical protein
MKKETRVEEIGVSAVGLELLRNLGVKTLEELPLIRRGAAEKICRDGLPWRALLSVEEVMDEVGVSWAPEPRLVAREKAVETLRQETAAFVTKIKSETTTDPGETPPVDQEPSTPLLGQRGQIFVTETAAQEYYRLRKAMPGMEHMNVGDARLELTLRLIDAKCRREQTPEAPAQFRARSKHTKLDISVLVLTDGPLQIVVHANVAQYLR